MRVCMAVHASERRDWAAFHQQLTLCPARSHAYLPPGSHHTAPPPHQPSPHLEDLDELQLAAPLQLKTLRVASTEGCTVALLSPQAHGPHNCSATASFHLPAPAPTLSP